MKKLGLTLYMLAGAGLVISGFATVERGLKENDRTQLDTVKEEYAELGNLGFMGFRPMDYKVGFSNGEKELLVDYSGDDYVVTKRDAVYEGLVASVYQDGTEYQVVTPEYDVWTTLSDINGQQLSTVIWHESFHAYQNTYFKIMENAPAGILTETELAERIDADQELKNLFTKELEILSAVTNEENTSDFRKIAIEYISVANKRDELLSDAEKATENFYEVMEGTAFYVESQIVRYENGDAIYRKNFCDKASEYAEGNAKYYRLGMLQSMLLDKLDPNWKDTYSFDRALDDVIAEYVG